ncbi:MAG: hypothetical protein QW625_03670, partial [Candidatus Nanoarchaeia archaeon]
MNKIKVFLNTGDHPIYFSLVKFSPQNIELVNKPQKENSSLFRIYSKRKNLMRIGLTKISSFLRIPRMFYFKTNADLIHTSRGIIPLNKKPWVMDIEHAKSFFDSHKVLYSERARKVVKKFIFSEHCKKIMPHCYMAKKSLTYHFGKQLDKKICVLYPAIEKRKYKARQDVKTVRILFIANKFFEKGGLEVLQ